MTEQVLKWYNTKPQVIKDAIDMLPPDKMYMFKDSKKECYITSYEEPQSGKLEDVTVTVQKTGEGSIWGLESINMNRVFGVKLTDLEPSIY
jgi:hypothetical protein